MRKTILKITLGGALAVTAAIGVQMASSNKTASNLFMQNVEALASGESGGGSCTASLSCSLASSNDYVRCTGTVCGRNASERYVECDGRRTYC